MSDNPKYVMRKDPATGKLVRVLDDSSQQRLPLRAPTPPPSSYRPPPLPPSFGAPPPPRSESPIFPPLQSTTHQRPSRLQLSTPSYTCSNDSSNNNNVNRPTYQLTPSYRPFYRPQTYNNTYNNQESNAFNRFSEFFSDNDLQYQDRRDERNHQLRMHQINNIDAITQSQIALRDQDFRHQLQRNEAFMNNTTQRQPISQERNARMIRDAADAAHFDINTNPGTTYNSGIFYENLHKPYYSHSYLFNGVKNVTRKNRGITIEFLNTKQKPVTIKLEHKNDYFETVQSDNLNHTVLVRVMHPQMQFSNVFDLCPCIDNCNLI